MPGSVSKTCDYNVSTYLKRVENYANSQECIDPAEDERLFEIAHQCGPDQTGNDGIQFAYKMMTGIPNPDRGPLDPRPMVPGVFRTYFPKEDSAENVCFNFDPEIREKESFCAGEEDPVTMESRPIRFCTPPGQEPFHADALVSAEIIGASGRTKNWRVFRTEMSVREAKAFIRSNIQYPDMVSEGIRQIMNAHQDPWALSEAAYDLMDLFIAEKQIDPEAKRLYGQMLTTLFQKRIEQLPDPIYQRGFMAFYAETYSSYLKAIREPAEIAQGWRNDYFDKGFGKIQGIVSTIGLFVATTPAFLKLGAVGLAKLGMIGAVSTPAWLVPALIATGVGLAAYGSVYVVSRFKGKSEFVRQFDQKVERRLPPKPKG